MPIGSMDFAGRVIQLDAPASQDLKLQGSGVGATSVLLEWSPKTKEAGEVELRARIVSASSGLGSIPIVRWTTEIGHGDGVWREPQEALPIVAGTPMLNYSLPARGMAWRTASRIFRIAFVNQGTIVGGPVAESTVQVTVLPVHSAHLQAYPYQHIALPFGAAVQQPFPMTAREWRVRDANGQPFALGAVSVLFVGVLGALFGPVDASLLADWLPIPHEAAAWIPASLAYADFR